MYIFEIIFIYFFTIFIVSYTLLIPSTSLNINKYINEYINNKKSFFSIEKKYKSTFFNNRIKFLVIHYTALNYTDSLKILTEQEVSSHYLIPEYMLQGKQKILLLTKEYFRAWHAGISDWQERNNLNDTSIGIEIVNLGYQQKSINERCWIPFTKYQIKILVILLKQIITKYNIDPTGIVGHNDIAPNRKLDPGPLFPWKQLADYGIGAWYNNERVNDIKQNLQNDEIDIYNLQKNLKQYGYKINITGQLDEQTKIVLQAFQMHFRPNNFSGLPDLETSAILQNLIEKYRQKN